MSQQFSPSQLRAARALLNWSRAELASQTGVSEPTIHRLENGVGNSEARTQNKIYTELKRMGIEFLEDCGVRLKHQVVDILSGRTGLQQFFNGVYEYSRKHGGIIKMFGIDETTFIDCIGAEFSQDYLERMTEVSRTRGDLKVLAIICEGDTNFCAAAYNEYRWISKDVFLCVPFYIYGEILAIMDFQTVPSPTIIMHKFPAIAEAYHKQFDVFWKISKTIPQKKQAG